MDNYKTEIWKKMEFAVPDRDVIWLELYYTLVVFCSVLNSNANNNRCLMKNEMNYNAKVMPKCEHRSGNTLLQMNNCDASIDVFII